MNDVAAEVRTMKRILTMLDAMPVPAARRVLQYVIDHQSIRVQEFLASEQMRQQAPTRTPMPNETVAQ